MKDNKKINKIKKQRGRSFEVHVKDLFKSHGFISHKIGSNSKDVPDVVSWDDHSKTVVAVEAKSTATNRAYVPKKQVQRCIDWVNEMGLYTEKFVILAFKFKGIGKYPNRRKVRYHYKIIPFAVAVSVSCNYDGICFSERQKIRLEDFVF